MQEEDLIYLEDESGQEIPYSLLRYFRTEGEEYALLCPHGEEATEDNAMLLHVTIDGEEESLSPVDPEIEEVLLRIALTRLVAE